MNQTYKDIRLIIWDNASDPAIADWLYRTQKGIEIIFSPRNHSLAYVTSEVFLKSDSEFVGKVDPDMIISSDWAERLITKHQEDHFGFIGGFHFRPEDLNGIEPIIEKGIWR